MMRFQVLSFCLITALTLVSCTKTSSVDSAGLITAATSVDKQTQEAFRNKDLDAFMKLYWESPDLIVVDAHKLHQGWEATREWLKDAFATDKGSTYELRDTKYVVHGDTVLSRSRFLYRTLDNGEFKTFQGWATDVKAMRDGKLVIVMVHIDPDPPAAS